MRPSILLTALAAVVLTAMLAPADAGRGARRRGGRRMEVVCSGINPEEVCSNGGPEAVGFRVSDGCNLCTCGAQTGRNICTIKSCPSQSSFKDDVRMQRRADRYCAKLSRKVAKKLRRYKQRAANRAARRNGGGAGAGGQHWPIKCFKERRLCRQQPGVSFFDGCNQCRCPTEAGGTVTAAQCQTVNRCPDFVGTRRGFKRHCRSLGARIEGGEAGGERRGRRRNRNRGEGESSSWFSRLLHRL